MLDVYFGPCILYCACSRFVQYITFHPSGCRSSFNYYYYDKNLHDYFPTESTTVNALTSTPTAALQPPNRQRRLPLSQVRSRGLHGPTFGARPGPARALHGPARPGPLPPLKRGPARPVEIPTRGPARPGPANTLPLIYSITKAAILMLRCFLQVPVTKQVIQYMWDKAKILCSMRVAQK